MKLSDLDTIIDRRGSGCLKYDFAVQRGKPKDVLPFWVADMDFKVAKPILDALEKRVHHGIFGYSESGEAYFKALAAWQETYFHWTIRPEWLIKTPGVVPAINLAVKALTKPGDGILINQPVYYPFLNAVIKNGRKLENSPLVLKNGHYEMDFADLEEKIVKGHVKLALLCTPHNPVGRVWTREELTRYADICLSHGVTIVADEIHEDFTYPGHVHTAFGTVSEEAAQNAIICTAPSKTFNIAGIVSSFAVIHNPEIRKQYLNYLAPRELDQATIYALAATEAAYNYGEEWLDQALAYIQKNIDFVENYLKEYIPQINAVKSEATFLVWLDCRALNLTQQELVDLFVNKAKLALNDGTVFGKEGEGFMRLNVGTPLSNIEKALDNLRKALNS